jgi:hypothetical protein
VKEEGGGGGDLVVMDAADSSISISLTHLSLPPSHSVISSLLSSGQLQREYFAIDQLQIRLRVHSAIFVLGKSNRNQRGLGTDLDAPEEAGAEVECAKEEAEELDKAHFGRGDVQFLLQEAVRRNEPSWCFEASEWTA